MMVYHHNHHQQKRLPKEYKRWFTPAIQRKMGGIPLYGGQNRKELQTNVIVESIAVSDRHLYGHK